MLLLELGRGLPEWSLLYSEQGILPSSVLDPLRQQWVFPCIHRGSSSILLAFWCLHGLAAVALLLGWRTRAMTLLNWFLLSSLQLRNPFCLDGGDHLLRLVLGWAIFLPWGTRWSLDARSHPEWKGLPDSYSSWATCAYTLQIASVYFWAGWSKFAPDWMKTRQALYYVFHLDLFSREPARQLLDFPEVLAWGSACIPWLELALAGLLVLQWTRPFGLLSLWLFHLGVALFLDLGYFPWVSLVVSLGLWPSRSAQGADENCRAPAYRLSKVSRVFVMTTFLYVTASNLMTFLNRPMPSALHWYGALTRTHQSWLFFAPEAQRLDGWMVLYCLHPEGKELDLLRPDQKLDWIKPIPVQATFRSQRQRLYLMTLAQAHYPGLAEAFLDYYAARHPWKELRLDWVDESTLPPGQTAARSRRILAQKNQ